jgi:hypothetical protein
MGILSWFLIMDRADILGRIYDFDRFIYTTYEKLKAIRKLFYNRNIVIQRISISILAVLTTTTTQTGQEGGIVLLHWINHVRITWIWSMANWVIESQRGYLLRPLLYLMVIFVTSQGTFDFLVYIRPRIITYRRRHPNSTWKQLILNGTMFSSTAKRNTNNSGSDDWCRSKDQERSSTTEGPAVVPVKEDNEQEAAENLEHDGQQHAATQNKKFEDEKEEDADSKVNNLGFEQTITADRNSEDEPTRRIEREDSVPLFKQYNEYLD